MTQILIADDSLVTQLSLCYVIESAGWRAHVVGNGHEALVYLAERSVDLLVCDVDMPVMHGLDLLDTLRQSDTWRDLPVILITGTEEQIELAGKTQASAVLTKPLSSWQILESVHCALGTTPGKCDQQISA